MTAKMYNAVKSSHREPEDMDKYMIEEWNGEDMTELLRSEESDEDDIVVPDTDLKHPTSSFNLRKKGRNIRGKKPTKLEPMDNMSGPFTEIVERYLSNKNTVY